MSNNQLFNNSEGLNELVDHINVLSLQASNGFGEDLHKTRYLHRAVLRMYLAGKLILQVATNRFSLIQFITAHLEKLQIQKLVTHDRAPTTNFEQ